MKFIVTLLVVLSVQYAAHDMVYSADFAVPAGLQDRWQAIKAACGKELDVCLEHCGNDAGCVSRCSSAHQERLKKEHQNLLHQQTSTSSSQSPAGPIKPGSNDKCPVCGMFVAKYPDWIGEIIFTDNPVAFFDGAKDLFKYYFNLQKYARGKTERDISAIYVSEYYSMDLIEARDAFFVSGSDVYGPMGKELIPFKTQEDAEHFIKDHKGERTLRFHEVTPAIIKSLD